jgi:hypothetical protein
VCQRDYCICIPLSSPFSPLRQVWDGGFGGLDVVLPLEFPGGRFEGPVSRASMRVSVLCKRRGCGKLPPLSRGIPTDNCGYPHYQQLLQLHNSHVTSAAITLTEIHQITQIEVQSIPRLRASEPSIYEETSCVDQASLTIDSSRNPRTDYGLC